MTLFTVYCLLVIAFCAWVGLPWRPLYCRLRDHAWGEEYRIEGAYDRDPTGERFRICTRCNHVEVMERPVMS